MQNGELLGMQFSKEFLDNFNNQSQKSYDNLVNAITKGVSEGIGILLEAK
jgi:hypothetical protein